MSKRDLIFRKPLMNAAGTLGFAPDFRVLKELGSLFDDFGAFITNPLSLRPRVAASQPALIEYSGGFLVAYRFAQSRLERNAQEICAPLERLAIANHCSSNG